jgi:hypothetical protein
MEDFTGVLFEVYQDSNNDYSVAVYYGRDFILVLKRYIRGGNGVGRGQ